MRAGAGLPREPELDAIDMYCPHCGKPLPIYTAGSNRPGLLFPWLFGFEYRTQTRLFGLPLVHVAFGYNPHTGLPRLARGIIAVGNFAIGLVAIGGIAAGGLVLSGIGLGIGVLAGIAVGWTAIGGIALGITFAIGGLAISIRHAIGGLPLILYLYTVKPSIART